MEAYDPILPFLSLPSNSLSKRKLREAAAILMPSIRMKQFCCPRGEMSNAESPPPIKLLAWLMQSVIAKYFSILLSLKPHQLIQLKKPLQKIELTRPQARLPIIMIILTQSENPMKRKRTENPIQTLQPRAPTKMTRLKGYFSIQLLQKAPIPAPKQMRLTLRGPIQWLSFCQASWTMMPKLIPLMDIQTRQAKDAAIILGKYFAINFNRYASKSINCKTNTDECFLEWFQPYQRYIAKWRIQQQ